MMSTMGRIGILALAVAALLLAAMPVQAQFARDGVFDYRWDATPPTELITTIDIQKALIWGGYYNGMADGSFGKQSRAAAISWQQAHGYDGTGALSPAQVTQLFNDGVHVRDAMKWTLLVDRNVGLVIPYPAALTEFKAVRPTAQGLRYFLDGSVNVSVMVVPPVVVANLDTLYNAEAALENSDRQVQYKARRDNWFVVSGINGAHRFYDRGECRSNGTAVFIISVPNDNEKLVAVLFSAFSNGLSVAPTLRVDARPNPILQTLESGNALLDTAMQTAADRPDKRIKIDPTGKTDTGKLALAGGQRAAAAGCIRSRARRGLYRQTRRHHARLGGRDQQQRVVDQLSRGARCPQRLPDARRAHQRGRRGVAYITTDRCVLRSREALPVWVTIRPFSDVKIGEHVYTIGAPRGLELTLAEGLVSSKRTIDRDRYIQTSAPISPALPAAAYSIPGAI